MPWSSMTWLLLSIGCWHSSNQRNSRNRKPVLSESTRPAFGFTSMMFHVKHQQHIRVNLDVEIGDQSITFDKCTARLNLITHQGVKHHVCCYGILNGNTQQSA